MMNEYKKKDTLPKSKPCSATQRSWRSTALWSSLLCDGVNLWRSSMWDEWHKCWQKEVSIRCDSIIVLTLLSCTTINRQRPIHVREKRLRLIGAAFWWEKKTDLKHTARWHGLTVMNEERKRLIRVSAKDVWTELTTIQLTSEGRDKCTKQSTTIKRCALVFTLALFSTLCCWFCCCRCLCCCCSSIEHAACMAALHITCICVFSLAVNYLLPRMLVIRWPGPIRSSSYIKAAQYKRVVQFTVNIQFLHFE